MRTMHTGNKGSGGGASTVGVQLGQGSTEEEEACDCLGP